MISQNLKNKKRQLYTILGMVLISLLTLTGCNFGDNNSKYVKKTLNLLPSLENEAKTDFEQHLINFYNAPVPKFNEFSKIFSYYLAKTKIDRADYAKNETEAIKIVLEFYNEEVMGRDEIGIRDEDVERMTELLKGAITHKNELEVSRYINTQNYINSFVKTDFLSQSDKMAFSFIGLGAGILGDVTGGNFQNDILKDMLRFTMLSKEELQEVSKKQGGEMAPFLWPTIVALEDINIIIVDSNLALIEVEGEKNVIAYYAVADLGNGLQIFGIAKTQASIKNFAASVLAKVEKITPKSQKQLFENRLVEIQEDMAKEKEIAKLLEIIEPYRAELQAAIKSRDIQKIKELINFQYLSNLIAISKSREASGMPNIEYDFSAKTIYDTDEKMLGVANDIIEILKGPSVVAKNEKNIILHYNKISPSKIDSSKNVGPLDISILRPDGILVLEKNNGTLKAKHTFVKIDDSSARGSLSQADFGLYLNNVDAISTALTSKHLEAASVDKARTHMFEHIHSLLSVSKVEWEISLGSATHYANISIKSIIQNTSDVDIAIRSMNLSFVKNNKIVAHYSVNSGDNVPAQRGIRHEINLIGNDDLVYFFSLVEKGELSLMITPNSIRYKGKNYTLPESEEDINIKQVMGEWVYEGFALSKIKDSTFTLPQVDKTLQDEYIQKFKDSKNENEKISTELVNKFLDSIDVSLVPIGDKLKLTVENKTEYKVSRLELSIELSSADNIIISSYTFDMRGEINPNSSVEHTMNVDSKMKGALSEQPKIDIKVTELRVNNKKIKRNEPSLISGFAMPFLEGKGNVLFSSKNIKK